MKKGTLIYVVGASGAGKDSICGAARLELPGFASVVFAHRYITRPSEVGGENHVALTMEEFVLRREHGLFAMAWDSHGNGYGIGVEIDRWLASGLSVVVNGSRAYLAEAAERYPEMVVIHIKVNRDVLRKRLQNRNRETPRQIEERLCRSDSLDPIRHRNLCIICNNESLKASVDTFIGVIGNVAGRSEFFEETIFA